MDQGEITAIDTHEQLRGKNDCYDVLFEKQYRAIPSGSTSCLKLSNFS
jgi:hypothetical protein